MYLRFQFTASRTIWRPPSAPCSPPTQPTSALTLEVLVMAFRRTCQLGAASSALESRQVKSSTEILFNLKKRRYQGQNNSQIIKMQMIHIFLLLLLFPVTRSQTEETNKSKFMFSDKENVSAKRDAEGFILAKDSGKQFTSSSSVHAGGGESELHCPLQE